MKNKVWEWRQVLLKRGDHDVALTVWSISPSDLSHIEVTLGWTKFKALPVDLLCTSWRVEGEITKAFFRDRNLDQGKGSAPFSRTVKTRNSESVNIFNVKTVLPWQHIQGIIVSLVKSEYKERRDTMPRCAFTPNDKGVLILPEKKKEGSWHNIKVVPKSGRKDL